MRFSMPNDWLHGCKSQGTHGVSVVESVVFARAFGCLIFEESASEADVENGGEDGG
jgi:hypothetical protein